MQESSDNRKNDVRNTAKDGAHVDAQIGVVHGDVTFYRVDDAATPEQRFDTGCNYLEGNMSRRAEEIIAKAFVDGYRTTRCCYYWMLSVLSDRPLDLLTELEQSNLTTATKEAEKHPPDEWTDAIDVVNALMTSIVDLDAVNEPTFADVDESMSRFDGLTSPRRNEIRRHLERILSGVVQDRLEV